MIPLFISRRHTYTVKPFLTIWCPSGTRPLQLISYQSLYRIESIRQGPLIFSDIDRLTPCQKELAFSLCEAIDEPLCQSLVLNHPQAVMTRERLLARLWKGGWNHYRIHPCAAEPDLPLRFPVFIRRIHDHNGPLTQLIHDRLELRNRIHALTLAGEQPNRLMIIEYLDTRGADGLFRKYSTFRIGNQIIPGHIIFSRHWVAKDSPPEPVREEERQFLHENPHREALMTIFKEACIEYGRIDYSLHEGNIQVWEINTNPILIYEKYRYAKEMLPLKQLLADRLNEALSEAAKIGGNGLIPGGEVQPIRLPLPRSPLLRWQRRLRPVFL
ncbi:MAG: hypothetical protein EHM62_08670 [Methylococcus sp.]|nr:MAG: hypothetical protein EHM62_08670 [Methylococcus sp.]